MDKLPIYIYSSVKSSSLIIHPFSQQLKEKKEKFEKEQAKKKDEFKSGRIVGKVSSTVGV